MRVFALPAALIILPIAGCAPPPAPQLNAEGQPESRTCFLVNQVRNFSAADTGQIVVHAAHRSAFELTAVGYCRDIDWANQVALQPLAGGSRLCVGDMADVIVRPLGGTADRCRVRVTRSLSEAEAQSY